MLQLNSGKLLKTKNRKSTISLQRDNGRNYKKWFNSKNRDERYDYLYTPEELAPIAKSIQSMAQKVEREPTRREVKKVIAATNNHYKGKAVVNAIDLKGLLGIKDNPVPDELAKAYPRIKGESAERGTRPLRNSRESAGSMEGSVRR